MLKQYYWDGIGIILIDIMGSDPHWKSREHYVQIPIVYDSDSGMYVAKALPKIKIPKRRFNGGLFSPSSPCLDLVDRLQFTFEDSIGNRAKFEYHLSETTKLTEIELPDPAMIINLDLYDRLFRPARTKR